MTEVLRFAEELMRHVRDPAIASCDALASGEMSGPNGDRWRAVGGGDVLHELIPDIVDQVLFKLLHAIDNGDLPLAWDGHDLAELGRREMAGWLLGEDGWRARFSTQRHVDT